MTYTNPNALQAINNCIERGISFVCYKMPGESPKLWITKVNISQGEDIDSGFVFYPFNKEESTPLSFSPTKVYDLTELSRCDCDEIKKLELTKLKFPKLPYISSKEEYLHQVDDSLKWLGMQDKGKIVISRVKSLDNYNYRNGASIIQSLMNEFPDALSYLLYSSQTGFWCGAFKEELLQLKDNAYYTQALAGTQIATNVNTEPNWSKKERQEQKLVVDFIQEGLKDIGAYEIERGNCSTVFSGKVAHISTKFKFKLNNGKVSKFLSTIHPSPAVCGLPKDKAYQLIKKLSCMSELTIVELLAY